MGKHLRWYEGQAVSANGLAFCSQNHRGLTGYRSYEGGADLLLVRHIVDQNASDVFRCTAALLAVMPLGAETHLWHSGR